jgi:hypothetical protein
VPYPNEHAGRVHDPKQYESFARKKIANGISAIFGVKNGKSEIQAYRFDKDVFTPEEAKKWLDDHNIKLISFEKASGKIKAFISLQCTALSLTSDEIIALIDGSLLSKIRAHDPHPFFQAYSICHEGTSQPTILGEKSKPIHWTRQAVESIKKVVAKGVKFFRGHNSDNSTDNRESLGEVVADMQKEIGGVLHHIVVGYFPDKEKVKDADICSQEANWNLFQKAGEWFAGAIKDLTGIALSNSRVDQPAFSGAKRLGMVQAFNMQFGGPGSGRRPEGGSKETDDEFYDKAVSDILNEIDKGDFDQYGIRMLPSSQENMSIGDILPESNVWEDNEPTDESLGGTSSLYISPYINRGYTPKEDLKRIIKDLKQYPGTTMALIGGDYSTGGNDPGESVISNAKIIKKYKYTPKIQAFNAIQGDENINKKDIGNMPEELKTVPFAELVTELKRRNTFPTQVFSLDEIKKDREISPIFEKLDKLEKDIQVKDKSLKDLEEEKKTLSKQINSVTAKDRLVKILDENKLIPTTDKQRKFIKERFKNIEDTSDEGLKKYIQSEIDERKRILDIEGIPEKDNDSGNTKTPNSDMTKAENNPLLEEDYNELL